VGRLAILLLALCISALAIAGGIGSSGAKGPKRRSAPSTGVSFDGGYESGDFTQWGSLQYQFTRPMSESFDIVSYPVRDGNFAAKFTVRQGFSPYGWNESTEVVHDFNDQGPGTEYWYGFSILFPRNWVDPDGWAIVEQFYTLDFPTFTGPAPIAIDASGYRLGINLNTGLSPVAEAPWFTWEYNRYFRLTKSLNVRRWNDFVLHIRWAADHTGFVQIWHRVEGQAYRLVLSLSGIPTLRYNPAFDNGVGDPIGLIKQGLYRESYCSVPVELGCQAADPKLHPRPQPPSVLYQDSFRRGASFSDVAP
jgi:hypothetical protein